MTELGRQVSTMRACWPATGWSWRAQCRSARTAWWRPRSSASRT